MSGSEAWFADESEASDVTEGTGMIDALLVCPPGSAWSAQATNIQASLTRAGLSCRVSETTADLAELDKSAVKAVVMGGGFTTRTRGVDGATTYSRLLSEAETGGLLRYVDAGGGFVGIHEQAWALWSEYVPLMGGMVSAHPKRSDEPFWVRIVDPGHPITSGIEDFQVRDELYLTAWDPAVAVLAGSAQDHPDVAFQQLSLLWARPVGKGRSIYCALGHWPDSFDHDPLHTILVRAVRWAGEQSADSCPTTSSPQTEGDQQ